MSKALTVIALVLSLLGIALPATAQTTDPDREHHLPFLRGNTSPQVLAERIRTSLHADPTGNSLLDRARCARDRSCAAPRNYLESIQVKRPELTLAGLADYIDHNLMEVTLTPAEYTKEYDMDCLVRVSDDNYQTVIGCMSRHFHPGETAYADRTTRELVLARDCTNPIRGIHRPLSEGMAMAASATRNCVMVEMNESQLDRNVLVMVLARGTVNMNDPCWAYRGPDTEGFVPLRTECPRGCSGVDVARFFRRPLRARRSVPIENAGRYVVRMPAAAADPSLDWVVVFCDSRGFLGFPSARDHSYSQGVTAPDYHEKLATLNPWTFRPWRAQAR